MNDYREKYISEFLNKKLGNLTEVEKQVIQSVSKNTMISTEVEEDEQEITFGQKLADKVAEFGGSWGFIIFFMTFLVAWILLNVFWLSHHGFDPYPFILLNLILSCIAAIQAPVIMMSQNRQEEKDRERAKKRLQNQSKKRTRNQRVTRKNRPFNYSLSTRFTRNSENPN